MNGSLHPPPPQQTLHGRIREDLRERIVRGVLQPNDRVPSESELMAQYGVSRITVRQALGDLQSACMIFKVAGKGSFVATPKPFQDLAQLQGFAEAMNASGHETFNQLLQLRSEPASAAVAQALALARGVPVTAIQRVRYLDRRPVSVDFTWLPQSLGSRIRRDDLATRDIFAMLETDLATPLGHADLAIDAVPAAADIAAHLDIDPGTPVLHIERLTHDRDGRPIDYEHLYCRPDQFQYRLRLHRA
ncbi:GntR family transcriptional regulator [Pelomonas aquatica]|jgi:GntR family transcriptional regulator|uniref:GntR family transcriptional regulator n=1 Tax=Pelomonas aquatica TaxID=431058 RepID=A0A9X4R9R0_9BURK|nr:GntR family transcriptional regulator [Pelomonas aquatica]MCY4756406.1 GntR family transcriptional regulator [Pelomonas aquatica]MDG0864628.1 GntR family transcriptional regulator [Pelomonas aquatica]